MSALKRWYDYTKNHNAEDLWALLHPDAVPFLDGDRHKICFAEQGKPRPTAFASEPGSGNLLQVWKREAKGKTLASSLFFDFHSRTHR